MIEKSKENKLVEYAKQNRGISRRKIIRGSHTIVLYFIKQITDNAIITNNIITPLLSIDENTKLDIANIAAKILTIREVNVLSEEDDAITYLLEGNCILLLDNNKKYIAANVYKVKEREVGAAELTYSVRGPKDSFTEDYDTNVSLIRYRLKDRGFKIIERKIGTRTKTKVGIIFIDDIANPKYVANILEKLNGIKIDGITSSGSVEKLLLNNTFDLFPQMGLVERSDAACSEILNGKIILLVEGSSIALSAPAVFNEFLHSGDDFYDSIYIAVLSKIVRISAVLITLTLSSLYVTIVSFHSDFLPPEYIIAIAATRATVPFNAFFEAFGMEFVSEGLREASIRLPKHIGPAIGIVGTIVIGQAAVSAKLVSPLMVILVSMSTLFSFIVPDYTIINPIRILRFLMLFLSATLGLYGFIIGLIFIITNMVSTNSFGAPFMSPLAPFRPRNLIWSQTNDTRLQKRRPAFLKTKDKTKK